MSELLSMSAVTLRSLVANQEISPVELVTETFKRLDEVEGKINAFVSLDREGAFKSAHEIEQKIHKKEPIGLLAGLPISVKDLIAVKDMRLTFGSRSLENNVAAIDAPSVARVRKEQAVIIGKTTTSEFGCKAVGSSPLTGITRNPWDLSKTPGGSSAGAGASIAAGVTPFGLATDGGGSIRVPSAFTGLFGIKAHFGRVPVFPTSATPTLAHVGPMARTVRDAALLLQAISGYDPRDPGSVSQPVPDFLKECDLPPTRLRLAWSPTLGYAKPQQDVLEVTTRAVKAFERMGCTVDIVDTIFDDPIEQFMAEFFAGAGTRLKSVLLNDRSLLDPAVAVMLEKALSQQMNSYYETVFKRYDLRTKLCEFFEKYDALLTPTLPVTAFDAERNYPDKLGNDENIISWIYYTYPFNLAGLPAASIPAGFSSDNLPIGLQIVGKHLSENIIFRLAAAFEQEYPWADKRPALTTTG